MTYTLYYTSADAPEPGSTWSVYCEKYEAIDSPEPIEGTSEHISQHADEPAANRQAMRLQARSYASGGPNAAKS